MCVVMLLIKKTGYDNFVLILFTINTTIFQFLYDNIISERRKTQQIASLFVPLKIYHDELIHI